VLGWELAQFDSAVDDVFGFRAVQVGLPEVDFLRQNRINFRFSVALEPGAGIAADPLQLPLASQSVDLVALPHGLEFHPNPHEVLRERCTEVIFHLRAARMPPRLTPKRDQGPATTGPFLFRRSPSMEHE